MGRRQTWILTITAIVATLCLVVIAATSTLTWRAERSQACTTKVVVDALSFVASDLARDANPVQRSKIADAIDADNC